MPRSERNNIYTAEHMGTHLDSPAHFYDPALVPADQAGTSRWHVQDIPIDRLFGIKAVVINISEKVKLRRMWGYYF